MHELKRIFLYLFVVFIHNCLGLLNTTQWWFRWQKMAPDWLWGGLLHLNIYFFLLNSFAKFDVWTYVNNTTPFIVLNIFIIIFGRSKPIFIVVHKFILLDFLLHWTREKFELIQDKLGGLLKKLQWSECLVPIVHQGSYLK